MAKKVLIVENEEKKIAWIKEYFNMRNIEFEEIAYLEGALKLVLEEPEKWEKIILDMNFPISSDEDTIERSAGKTFLKEIKENGIQIPIIINSRQLLNKEEYTENNIVGHFVGSKVFDFARLMEIFEKNVEAEEQSI